MQNQTNVNRKHKDRLFRFIFKEKSALLSLYNAINDSNYDNLDELEIYTMEDYVYMGMKNDVSFLIDWNINLFEHQSTYSLNMPLRGLLYIASNLKKFVEMNRLDMYASRRLSLPIPRYYVFYNGTKTMPEEEIMYLTDSMPMENAKDISCVEFKAHILNINEGYNPKMMERCPLLKEYAIIVSDVRKNLADDLPLAEAVDYAVEQCIRRDGPLADVLRGHRAEVTDTMLKEYDEIFHIECEKKISREEGRAEERINTERERQRAEVAEQKAEAAEQKAEAAEQKAEAAEEKVKCVELEKEILKLMFQGKTKEEVADIKGISLEDVEKVLSEE